MVYDYSIFLAFTNAPNYDTFFHPKIKKMKANSKDYDVLYINRASAYYLSIALVEESETREWPAISDIDVQNGEHIKNCINRLSINSHIYIEGHGSPGAQYIYSSQIFKKNKFQSSCEQLAQLLIENLNESHKIENNDTNKRLKVSFLMCSAAAAYDFSEKEKRYRPIRDRFYLDDQPHNVENSFAYSLAKEMFSYDVLVDILARDRTYIPFGSRVKDSETESYKAKEFNSKTIFRYELGEEDNIWMMDSYQYSLKTKLSSILNNLISEASVQKKQKLQMLVDDIKQTNNLKEIKSILFNGLIDKELIQNTNKFSQLINTESRTLKILNKCYALIIKAMKGEKERLRYMYKPKKEKYSAEIFNGKRVWHI